MPHEQREQTGLERFANRLGKASISFLTQTPQIELDRQEAEIALIESQAQIAQQNVEETRAEAQNKLELENLSRTAFGRGPQADAALAEIFARDPVKADQLFEGLGAIDEGARQEAARDAAAIRALPPGQRRPAILERASRLESAGRDASDTLSLLDMDPETQTNQLRIIEAAALTSAQRASGQRAGGIPAEQQTFEALIEGFTSEEQEKARRVEARIAPAAIGTGAITTATTAGLTEQVAASEEEIRQRTKFAEMTGSSRAKTIDKALVTITGLDKNIRNLDRATAALREGASTGAVERFFPSIREATVKLNQVQGELALDVIGAVTFGALSQGELDLAKSIALPTGLQPDALLEHLEQRKTAQEKLRQYFLDQIDFLDQGGSIAGFLRQQQRQAPAEAPPTGRTGGQIMEDAQGNRARVFPDGTFEEL